jgi:hypothetical protein
MVLTAAIASNLGSHSTQSVLDVLRPAFVQPHPMSKAKVIFLAILVVFFCGLFMASYIWMRRPDFGQSGKPVAEAGIVDGQQVVPIGTSSVDGSGLVADQEFQVKA